MKISDNYKITGKRKDCQFGRKNRNTIVNNLENCCRCGKLCGIFGTVVATFDNSLNDATESLPYGIEKCPTESGSPLRGTETVALKSIDEL
jgi:hypothetical protein